MISEYQNQSIVLQTRTTYDRYGQASLAAPVTLPARVQDKMAYVHNGQGEMVMADAKIYLEAGTVVSPGDKITYGARTYQIIAVNAEQGLDASMFVVVYLGAEPGSKK